jgi:hypothetical protein
MISRTDSKIIGFIGAQQGRLPLHPVPNPDTMNPQKQTPGASPTPPGTSTSSDHAILKRGARQTARTAKRIPPSNPLGCVSIQIGAPCSVCHRYIRDSRAHATADFQTHHADCCPAAEKKGPTR